MSNNTAELIIKVTGNAKTDIKALGSEIKKISDNSTKTARATKEQAGSARKLTSEQVKSAQAVKKQADSARVLDRNLQRVTSEARKFTQGTRKNPFAPWVKSADQLRRNLKAGEQQMGRMQRMATKGQAAMGKMASVGGTARNIGAGVAAGGYVMANQLQKARPYDEQLAYMAGTATGGQGLGVVQRMAVKRDLNHMIMQVVRQAGGTREGAALSADALLASGQFDLKSLPVALKAAQLTSVGAGASEADAAALLIALKKNGITDYQAGLDKVVRGGQLGSFEARDQARYLPSQLALASAAGYRGQEGLAEIVAMNQVATKTAGNADEAGNNVVNLLAKLSSAEFQRSVAKAVPARKGDKVDASGDFNWNAYVAEQRGLGKSAVESFVNLLEREMQSNAEYQRLKADASKATGAEQAQKLDAMAGIVEGGQIGELIADRQALLAALAVVSSKDEMAALKTQISGSSGAVASEAAFINSNEFASKKKAEQEALAANYEMYNNLAPVLQSVYETAGDVAKAHPAVTTAAYSAATALGVLAAASAGFTLSDVLTKKGKGSAVKKGGKFAKVAARVGGSAAAGLSVAGSGVAAASAGLAAAGAGGYAAGTGYMALAEKYNPGAGDRVGEQIAEFLAIFGNDNARAALEANQRLDTLINETQRNTAAVREQRAALLQIGNRPINVQVPYRAPESASVAKPVVFKGLHEGMKLMSDRGVRN